MAYDVTVTIYPNNNNRDKNDGANQTEILLEFVYNKYLYTTIKKQSG